MFEKHKLSTGEDIIRNNRLCWWIRFIKSYGIGTQTVQSIMFPLGEYESRYEMLGVVINSGKLVTCPLIIPVHPTEKGAIFQFTEQCTSIAADLKESGSGGEKSKTGKRYPVFPIEKPT